MFFILKIYGVVLSASYAFKYGLLENNIVLQNEVLSVNQDKTYCLWTWLDENTPNDVQNSYFVANLEFKAEYKPK